MYVALEHRLPAAPRSLLLPLDLHLWVLFVLDFFVCFHFVYHLLWLHQASNWVFMSLFTLFSSVLVLVTAGLYVFMACPMSDEEINFQVLKACMCSWQL